MERVNKCTCHEVAQLCTHSRAIPFKKRINVGTTALKDEKQVPIFMSDAACA